MKAFTQMRMPKRGQKGFTLIELLIVVAILGVLAAVIIPNVSRFFGSGEEEARKTEKTNVQLAMDSMMVDNSLTVIPNPVTSATPVNDMGAFPDTTSDDDTNSDKVSDPDGNAYTIVTGADLAGYLLFEHDIIGDDAATDLVNYMRQQTTDYYYTVDADGTVHQFQDAAKTGGELT